MSDLVFRRSSYSGARNDCVEVAETANLFLMRDSKNAEQGHLTFPQAEWAAWLRAVKDRQIGQ
ncbi:DUF397 domain-containing protein [Marinitenerispora sediminis]|uniref:DUF397 domain-containing protein n=1 Tax=Marinitenerispora sediminis TaxID=1931232 RepID=A0A368T9Z9_9ACTN|nr:DUF397 domain-containing protein [Marinitenerispora sediminis]RCV52543.1 DUF397 domain-containing protein [Marinitenerispora sediminis]RCV59502.1 DUF397 domain-containing protein [Marinitenerispora sediminis]RCV59609.1 DUF397 domain-containing protein [Marinitenerispora sediminis]